MRLSRNFLLQEFVPPQIYDVYGERSRQFLDQGLIVLVQALRDDLNRSIVINNWHSGGKYKESGFRMPHTTTGAPLSQHKFGRAVDIKVAGMVPEEVRKYIRLNFEYYRSLGLTTIEKDTPTWTHLDLRWTGVEELYEVEWR